MNLETAIKEIEFHLHSDKMKKSLQKNNIFFAKIEYVNYQNTTVKDMLIASLLKLAQFRENDPMKARISVEDWNMQAFVLFPIRFCISLRWAFLPDTRKFSRVQRKIKEEGLIFGHPKFGFSVSRPGIKLATEVLNQIQNLIEKPTAYTQNSDYKTIKNTLTTFEKEVSKKLLKNAYFLAWNEKELPTDLALHELGEIIGIPTGSPLKKYSQKIIELIQKDGALDSGSKEFIKARKFLLLQVCFHHEKFTPKFKIKENKVRVPLHFAKIVRELNLEVLVKKAVLYMSDQN